MRDGVPAKLRAACPDLYPEGSPECGFSCPDAWLDVVERMSHRLQAMIAALPEAERGAYRCDQVKAKFRGLRCYMSRATLEMVEVIDEAEIEVECIEAARPFAKFVAPEW